MIYNDAFVTATVCRLHQTAGGIKAFYSGQYGDFHDKFSIK